MKPTFIFKFNGNQSDNKNQHSENFRQEGNRRAFDPAGAPVQGTRAHIQAEGRARAGSSR